MMSNARAHTTLGETFSDADNRLISAEEPLAGLQRASGGTLPGVIAIPELLAEVAKARRYGLRLSRKIHAVESTRRVIVWVELEPVAGGDGEGCLIRVLTWQVEPLAAEDETRANLLHRKIDRGLAELTARLDPSQNLIAFDAAGADLHRTERAMSDGIGRPWTEFVRLDGNLPAWPLHWRMLDGATCRLEGSKRTWRIQLEPVGAGEPGSGGFALYLTPTTPLAANEAAETEELPPPASFGNDLVPVLRAPIAQLIDNAHTISRRLAGPLAEEYSAYASDIAVAGQHLLSLIDDLAQMEEVEALDFIPAVERIDLADTARRAVKVLGADARLRRITIIPPAEEERQFVAGDDRRTLQVVLNLLSNAVKYAPEESEICLRLDSTDRMGSITIADQGRGLSAEEQARVFDKFERLGRTDSSGTGLGLYISRRIAEAMRGKLTIESAPGRGARFTLSLPLMD